MLNRYIFIYFLFCQITSKTYILCYQDLKNNLLLKPNVGNESFNECSLSAISNSFWIIFKDILRYRRRYDFKLRVQLLKVYNILRSWTHPRSRQQYYRRKSTLRIYAVSHATINSSCNTLSNIERYMFMWSSVGSCCMFQCLFNVVTLFNNLYIYIPIFIGQL